MQIDCTVCSAKIPSQASRCPVCDMPQINSADNCPRKQLPGYNAYGVSRHVPEWVKHRVRLESGFGCVFCGIALCDYDHFSPEFSKIKSTHAPSGIALLCSNHHDRKTRGVITNDDVARARRSPWALKHGFVRDNEFFGPGGVFNVHVGEIGRFPPFGFGTVPLRIAGDPVLWFEPYPEGPTASLNAVFQYRDGSELLKIRNNILTLRPKEGIDIQTPKAELIVKFQNEVILHLKRVKNQLCFLRANVFYKQKNFEFTERGLALSVQNPGDCSFVSTGGISIA